MRAYWYIFFLNYLLVIVFFLKYHIIVIAFYQISYRCEEENCTPIRSIPQIKNIQKFNLSSPL